MSYAIIITTFTFCCSWWHFCKRRRGCMFPVWIVSSVLVHNLTSVSPLQKVFIFTPVIMKRLFCSHLSVCLLIFGQCVTNFVAAFIFLRIWVIILKTEVVKMFVSWGISSFHSVVFLQRLLTITSYLSSIAINALSLTGWSVMFTQPSWKSNA
jgi:hypothetical protein